EKPQGKNEPLKMEKHYKIVPRGIALVIGCNTFPTWNGYPGMFASLATGNAVIVKPHPNAILPLAVSVQIARDVLNEAGFDPDIVTMVAHEAGIDTAEGHLSLDQVAQAISESVQKLLGDPARAVEILGAVVNDGVAQRIEAARDLGSIVLDSQPIAHPQFKDARIRTPLIVKLDAKDEGKYLQEWFGPIAFVIATDGTGASLDIARRAVRDHGALTLSVYSKSPAVVDGAVAAA